MSASLGSTTTRTRTAREFSGPSCFAPGALVFGRRAAGTLTPPAFYSLDCLGETFSEVRLEPPANSTYGNPRNPRHKIRCLNPRHRPKAGEDWSHDCRRATICNETPTCCSCGGPTAQWRLPSAPGAPPRRPWSGRRGGTEGEDRSPVRGTPRRLPRRKAARSPTTAPKILLRVLLPRRLARPDELRHDARPSSQHSP